MLEFSEKFWRFWSESLILVLTGKIFYIFNIRFAVIDMKYNIFIKKIKILH